MAGQVLKGLGWEKQLRFLNESRKTGQEKMPLLMWSGGSALQHWYLTRLCWESGCLPSNGVAAEVYITSSLFSYTQRVHDDDNILLLRGLMAGWCFGAWGVQWEAYVSAIEFCVSEVVDLGAVHSMKRPDFGYMKAEIKKRITKP